VAEEGVAGEVTVPPLADWAALERFQAPWEILQRGKWEQAQGHCAAIRRDRGAFILCSSSVRPFERMQFLRGSEELFLDIAEESEEFMRLRQMVHEFFLEEIRHSVRLDCDAVQFMDDWGSQRALLISPAQWRRLFKPLYKEYCELIHGAGKKAFMHSDGFIFDIYEDLIEIGVDAINSQLFSMDIEEIGRRFGGRITFWGEIDRQHILPHGSVADVYAAVTRVRKALDKGCGGLIAQCEWGVNNPPENIAAVYEAWDMPLEELLGRTN